MGEMVMEVEVEVDRWRLGAFPKMGGGRLGPKLRGRKEEEEEPLRHYRVE